MKPTREQVQQWVFESGLDVRVRQIVELAYQAGAEKGKADYEREHLRHAVALPDALRVMQEQVAEACAKVCDDLADCEQNTDAYRAGAHWCREIIRAGEWRKFMEGKP